MTVTMVTSAVSTPIYSLYDMWADINQALRFTIDLTHPMKFINGYY